MGMSGDFEITIQEGFHVDPNRHRTFRRASAGDESCQNLSQKPETFNSLRLLAKPHLSPARYSPIYPLAFLVWDRRHRLCRSNRLSKV